LGDAIPVLGIKLNGGSAYFGYFSMLSPRSNFLQEICTPDIRISRVSAGYQKKIDQISIKHLRDFSRIIKKISAGYT